MTTTLRNARFWATLLAHDRFALLGIDINVAIYVVHHHGSTSPGQRQHQHWFQGESTDGRTFNVLIESPYPTTAKIITVTETTEGGQL